MKSVEVYVPLFKVQKPAPDTLTDPVAWILDNLAMNDSLKEEVDKYAKQHNWTGAQIIAFLLLVTDGAAMSLSSGAIETMKQTVSDGGAAITIRPPGGAKGCLFHPEAGELQIGEACSLCVERALDNRPDDMSEADAREVISEMIRYMFATALEDDDLPSQNAASTETVQ